MPVSGRSVMVITADDLRRSMSLFGEFHVPSAAFALSQTFQRLPNAIIEIERVVATDELITPYFWVSDVTFESFESATADDPSVQHLQQLDTFETTALYRAEWTENVESIVYAYTQIGAVILEATGTADYWQLQMRFDDHSTLQAFQTYCNENEILFQLHRLHELSQPKTGEQYGLTAKQHNALCTAYEMGYFEPGNGPSLAAVADELGITQQSLSELLKRGHNKLIETTLTVGPVSPHESGKT